MTDYVSASGKKSGVTAYEIGKDFIKVEFNNSKIYTYRSSNNNKIMIEEMKSLALASEGLSTYIARNKLFLNFS
ncbi:hypothetical protein SAMN02745146_2043 [Hymenobacter daecheongensis DSM 21074]|uniref:KTSC domain-containing protein n=1 Tax=Hymenobacter daecheongensis DSM 21074 TaxID=1121955 RepID=A0A1M6FYU0_9BACT|nr:hypothetical protein SAMN02745146_2043 [Hymenobacter daecheongensis DSM 21074]